MVQRLHSWRGAGAVAALSAGLCVAPCASAQQAPEGSKADKSAATAQGARKPIDHSGRSQTGKASFYAPEFNGRKMADGTPMNPRGDNAASRTLPLGTTARVTNLDTG